MLSDELVNIQPPSVLRRITQRHSCMYLWPSPLGDGGEQIHLCLAVEKWYPVGRGTDKSCPHLDEGQAHTCAFFVPRRVPTLEDAEVTAYHQKKLEMGGSAGWEPVEKESVRDSGD